jgi:glutathione S-transferase
VDLENKPRDFLEVSPYGLVPALVDGDTVVYESAIINEYIEDKFPNPPLMPPDPAGKARVRIWIDFCNTKLGEAARGVVHGENPDQARIGLRRQLARLENEMDGKDFIAGGYSLADINYFPFLARLEERCDVSLKEYPRLKAWMERVGARPAVQASL